MRYYAAMVRQLFVEEMRFGSLVLKVHLSTWGCILVRSGGCTLLPRLDTLHWDVTDESGLSTLCFLAPSIHDLQLRFRHPWLSQRGQERKDWQFGCSSLLSNASLITDKVNTLSILLGTLQSPSSFVAIACFHNVRILTITCDYLLLGTMRTETAGIYHLGSLLHLEQLILNLEFEPEHTSPPSTSQHLPIPLFPSLGRLVVRDHPSTGHLYQIFKDAPLIHLEVETFHYEDISIYRERCRLWACTFAQLQIFQCSLEHLSVDPPYEMDALPLSAIIDPLFNLHCIHTIILDIPFPDIHFEDMDLTRMAAAWPKLTELMVYPCERPFVHHSMDSCMITYNGLLQLTSRCPELTWISLPMLYLSAETAREVRLDNISPHNLRFLNVSVATVHDYALCAEWLDTCFPHLDDGGPVVDTDVERHNGRVLAHWKGMYISSSWNCVLEELYKRRNHSVYM